MTAYLGVNQWQLQFKKGKNILVNRLRVLNNMIDYNWLNLRSKSDATFF